MTTDIFGKLESIGFFEWIKEKGFGVGFTAMLLDNQPIDSIERSGYSAIALKFFREKYNICGYVRRSSKDMQRHLEASSIELRNFEFAASTLDGSFIKELHLRSSDTYESATVELLEMLVDFTQQKKLNYGNKEKNQNYT